MSIRVAAIQMCSGTDVADNLAVAERLLRAAASEGAILAVLPENFAFLGRSERERATIAETGGEGPMQEFLARQARALGLWVVGGTIPLLERDEARPRAACLLYDPTGRLAARYDKIHLFDVGLPGANESYHESAGTSPGRRAVVAHTTLGRLGLAVCYDVRFPELFRAQSGAGVDCIALPAAFTRPTGRAHWEILVRTRAVENLVPVVAAAQWGEHASGRQTWGDSMVVNHWGEVLARLPDGVGIAVADLDAGAMQEARRRFPALDHRLPPGQLEMPMEEPT